MGILEILLFAVIFAGALCLALFNGFKKLPSAYAWDPNSHDKMATYSLELLEKGTPKSLLGWVLSQEKFAAKRAKNYIQDQIRRGSIEEDMNSYIIINSSYLGLDGTNGSYHFYNPINKEGLSDSDKLTNAAAFVTMCDNIMPSAVQRATSLDESLDKGMYMSPGEENMSWHFDIELRNYTVVDAMRYYLRGYHHLGFYAIGRTVHLLQDMAVPAHVRNDSHSGKVGDPKDPLEQFADEADGNMKDWTFSAERIYSAEGKRIFEAACSIWNAERHSYYNQTAALFHNLAQWTYNNFYSVNTIPGNYDSHDPEQAKVKPFAAAKDVKKCHPALFHLAHIFNDFGNSIAGDIAQLLPQCFANDRSDVISSHIKTLTECQTVSNRCVINEDCGEYSISDKRHTCEKCFFDVHLVGESIKIIINEISSILSDYEGYVSGRIPAEALEHNMREGFKMQGNLIPAVCKNVLQEYKRYNLAVFVNEAANNSADYVGVMQRWLESFPDQQILWDIIKKLETSGTLYSYTIKPNAPYCLNYEVIQHQWLTTQPRAVAFGAYLMANWFEWQYNPARNSGQRPGVGLWLNENVREGEEPVLHSLQKIEVGNTNAVKAKKTVTLGIANHLPCHLDMAVEIELLEEDDFIKENGLEIEINWGRLSPDWAQTEDEYMIATGSEPPKKKVWTEEQVDAGTGSNVSKFVLSGSGGQKSINIILEQTEPYNLSLMENFGIPQSAGGTGGISRVEENNDILKYNLNFIPGDGQGQNEINASLLMMEFSTPATAENRD